MKRFFFLLTILLALATNSYAQNANRNGFFLELGIGGMVGENPRYAFETTDNVVKTKCLHGTTGDFGFGFRLKTASHWAYEIKAEAMLPFVSPINALTGRFLPVGFRYTSVEIWKNYSLYAHFNLGGVITALDGYLTELYDCQPVFFPSGETKIKGYKSEPGFGVAYSLGVGANITTHLYAELCWDGQVLINCYGKKDRTTLNGGLVGFIIGYRF